MKVRGMERRLATTPRSAAVAIVAAAVAVVGCGSASDSRWELDAAAQAQVEAFRDPVDPAPTEISEEETLPVRLLIEQAVREENPSVLADGLDVTAFVEAVAKRRGVLARDAKDFREWFMPEGAGENFVDQILGEVIAAAREGGDYRFLRVMRHDDRTVAIYRVLGPNGELNYHEWSFVRSDDGAVRVDDLYLYWLGEWLTDGAARMVEISQGKAGEKRTPAQFAEYQANAKNFLEAARFSRDGDADAFDRALAKLPEELRERKFMLVMAMRARGAEPEEQARTFERLAELYPGDPATDLAGLAFYSSDERYEEAIAATDRLAERIGGDPYQTVLRANYLLSLDRIDEAEKAALAAMEADDSLSDVYIALALIASKKQDYPQAVRWIRELSELFQMSPQDLIDFDAEGLDPAWKNLERSEAWQALTVESQSP